MQPSKNLRVMSEVIMERILVYGSGGLAKEIAFLIEEINKKKEIFKIFGFLDDNTKNHGKTVYKYTVLGGSEYLKTFPGRVSVILGIGEPKIKQLVYKKISHFKHVNYPVLIHPNVSISSAVEIGEGTVITAGNILTVNIVIGRHCTINLDCTIGHDVVIEDFSSLMPSVNVSGNVTIKRLTNIGTGVQIIQGLTIGAETIVGAGAVVTKDIPDRVIAVGAPAKAIKENI